MEVGMVSFWVNLNWLALAIGFVVTYVLGALWYSPLLFGNKWLALRGETPESITEAERTIMVVAAVDNIVTVIFIGVVAALLSVGSSFLWVMVLLGVASLAGTLMLTCVERRPYSLIWIDGGWVVARLVPTTVALFFV